jgi:hypothetical protein
VGSRPVFSGREQIQQIIIIFNTPNNIGGQFSSRRKPEYPEETTDHGQATGKLYHLRLLVQSMSNLFSLSYSNKKKTQTCGMKRP